MTKETLMGKKYRVYKNSPKCTICGKPMRYLYTDVQRYRSVWKCREDNVESVTKGYPEDECDDPSKRGFIKSFTTLTSGGVVVPGAFYDHRRTREYNFQN